MCRWLVYSGPPIHLDTVLFEPENSLINQSLHARLGASATNGDGFGIGWYGDRPAPGQFRDVLPAWNDDNLRSVAEQISSPLFFAHVRASTGTATSRSNCHPFRHASWLFMHNGRIGGFDRIRRELEMCIDPALYAARLGTTDSEALFYLMLTHGLDADPPGATRKAVAQVLALMAAAGTKEPFRLTAAASDGRRTVAIRYSSDAASPSLFYGRPALAGLDGGGGEPPIMILSEPLDADGETWIEVPEGHAVLLEDGEITVLAFSPDEPVMAPVRASA
jgi:glutamine amidotransferase